MSDVFANAMRKSADRDLSATDLLSAIAQLASAGEKGLVEQLYREWLSHNSDHPVACAIWFNLGVFLADGGDLKEACEALSSAIRSNPNFAPPYINLGGILDRLGEPMKAIDQWSALVGVLSSVNADSIFHKVSALKQIGRVLETARIESRAEDVLRQCLELAPTQRDVIQHWIALRQTQCKWPVIDPPGSISRSNLMGAISPLSLAVLTDDPVAQLANAHHYNKCDVSARLQASARARLAAHDRSTDRPLRIGYLSSDLRDHAVGFLLREVFGLHDRNRFKIYAYYCGIKSADATNAKIRSDVDVWVDISSMSDEAAEEKITSDKIDILVDLNGYTKDARLNLIARRPAPVIVNWLGFPGTMGSPYHNYIIADANVIPPGWERYYSEGVMRLPCYQPNDRTRIVSPLVPTRQDVGLPDDAFVFCCFNGSQKITRQVFDRWMQILNGNANSVLWLLSATEETNQRLRDLAQGAGVTAERIVFAPRRPNPDHLARYPLADVFLDTFPYGAHTTASDALWMGVPVLTVPGQSFASRVCGSLVSAAGLGELVCSTHDQYVERAIEISKSAALLQQLRDKLNSGRASSILFDTTNLVRELESRFEEMWRAFVTGHLPQPDLSNLELLQEISCSFDHEAMDVAVGGDRRPYYREEALIRGAISTALTDRRLSCEADPEDSAPVHAGEFTGSANRIQGGLTRSDKHDVSGRSERRMAQEKPNGEALHNMHVH